MPASGVPYVPRTVAPQVLSELDEIHLIDVGLAQKFHLTEFGTGYTGDACAYRVDCAAPFLLQPIAPDGRAYRRRRPMLTRTARVRARVTSLGRAVRTACRVLYHRPRLPLGTTTQLRLGRTAGPWGVTDPRVSRLHARICAGPGPPTVTAEGSHPCVLIKALTGAQQRP